MSDITGSSLSKASLADIEYSDLELKENVGSGGFGTVFKGQWISKNKTVAIKMMMVLVEREVSYNRLVVDPLNVHTYLQYDCSLTALPLQLYL